ncbi:MAG: glycosyltransferase 61 family protein [Alphaproteobacteria bacterium]
MLTPETPSAPHRAKGRAMERVATPARRSSAVVFRDIEVVPGDAYRLRSILTNGGPVWPRFHRQTTARFMQGGVYVDRPVVPSGLPLQVIERPCVWGGYAIPHFGHLVADHMTRVLEGRVTRPDDLFLFLNRPGEPVETMPDYIWQVMDWYGLARAQVHMVTVPVLARELRCYPQAEPFGSGPPSADYLSLLAENARQRGLQPQPADLVYVGRVGMLALGKGGLAGEAYLTDVLKGLGVQVLDPAQASLTEQLAAYAGAKVLVFAEGSAMHGRQLLGRLEQQIVVLNRRKGARLAEAALVARCDQVTYVEASGQTIGMGTLDTLTHSAQGLSLLDLDAVFASFARFGVDLQGVFDPVAFAAAVVKDAESWLYAQAFTLGAAVFDLDEAYGQLHAKGVPVRRVYEAEGD